MKMRRKKKFLKSSEMMIVLTTIVVFLLCLNFIGFYREIQFDVDQQVKIQVKQESDQTVTNANNIIAARKEWLDTLASMAGLIEYVDASSMDDWWEMLEQLEVEGNHRIGISDNQGYIYYGKHEKEYIGDRAYYQSAMRGTPFISKVNEDDFGQEDTFIMATPIYNVEDIVVGIVAIEYSTIQFGKRLNSDDLQGYGYNLIIDHDGKLVASHTALSALDSFFELFESRTLMDGYDTSQMKEDIANDRCGYLEYYDGDKKRMLYYQPVGINDWVSVSIVADHAYYSILNRIEESSSLVVLSTMFLVTIEIVFLAYAIISKNKEIKFREIDRLTHLYRRAAGIQLIEKRHKKKVKPYGCIFIDLDNLKNTNDTYGHEQGDMLIQNMGEVIRKCTSKKDICYRFGGDEFCIWLYGMGNESSLFQIAEDMQKEASLLNSNLSFSMGMTLVRENDLQIAEVIKRADDALYQAKREGKNRVVVH